MTSGFFLEDAARDRRQRPSGLSAKTKQVVDLINTNPSMSYRIYLQIPNGSAFEHTETGSRSIAESVFRAFLERDELENKEVSLYLMYQRTALAVHHFDARLGTTNDWQGRVDDIAWPQGNGKVGRPTELEAGARHNVYLDAVSITRARKLDRGNISEGIRIALSRI